MDFLHKLLTNYSLSEEEYYALTRPVHLFDLPDPRLFLRMDEAVSLIKKTIRQHKKIIVYGDYDCDGVMSTTILVHALRKMGADVGYYIPSRYQDGYGINRKMIDAFNDKQYKLIITVDNGISQIEEIAYARQLGIDVIVTDHHTVGQKIPDANYILHPQYSAYSQLYSCGAYVSLMLASTLLNRYDEYEVFLASIATISDMMPLQEHNRTLVRIGINLYNERHFAPIYELIQLETINEETIGMSIAPKINAVGRIIEDKKVNYLVQFLLSDSKREIVTFSNWIKEINLTRQTLLKETISEGNDEIIVHDGALIAVSNTKEGLIGLLAARYMNLYHLPTIVFCPTEQDPLVYKGSARADNGFSIVHAFKNLEHYLLNFGGHKAAGGCSISRDQLTAFSKAFNELAKQPMDIIDNDASIAIALDDINWTNFYTMDTFRPFGIGFAKPLFRIEHVATSALSFIKDGQHISTLIKNDVKILGFNITQETLKSYDKITVYGEMNLNEFRGRKSLIYQISDWQNENF
ncbi:MAG TPA: DHH family phosphoesterase [Bacilli bacterium]|nr:DHH family phosphoesterase [Bacilli bacterium]